MVTVRVWNLPMDTAYRMVASAASITLEAEAATITLEAETEAASVTMEAEAVAASTTLEAEVEAATDTIAYQNTTNRSMRHISRPSQSQRRSRYRCRNRIPFT